MKDKDTSINGMVDDDRETQGAKTPVTMVLTLFTRHISVSAVEGFNYKCDYTASQIPLFLLKPQGETPGI